MITTVTFNPAVDKTAQVQRLEPGRLNRLQNVRQDAGGKGINVSKTLNAIGVGSRATGFLAGSAGTFIRKRLEELGITHDFVEIEGNTRTNLKVLDADMTLTELNEAGPACSQEDILRLQNRLEGASGVLVLSGNVGPGVRSDIYRQLTVQAHSQGLQVILDADGPLFAEGIQAGPDVIKPNRFELSQYFQVPEETLDTASMTDLSRKLMETGTQLVVVSMGEEGSLFVTRDQAMVLPALKIPFQSAVGAGDAMVAGLACSLEQGLSLEETATLAVALSAGACMTEGTQPADADTVEALKACVTWTWL
ncbi:1-phosphofructokinase [uncultured Faecalibaculum sp.]|uniref:1-phosphofructokinase n=1 Tax=uncultured Faecalibaculum sp. TaxID=1729681 RepID=UPI0025E32BC3|nr:1-phosphofructokinase [uncultured Faecalibaculum sp.]